MLEISSPSAPSLDAPFLQKVHPTIEASDTSTFAHKSYQHATCSTVCRAQEAKDRWTSSTSWLVQLQLSTRWTPPHPSVDDLATTRNTIRTLHPVQANRPSQAQEHACTVVHH